jgi:hypothetical protein
MNQTSIYLIISCNKKKLILKIFKSDLFFILIDFKSIIYLAPFISFAKPSRFAD